MLAEIFRVVTDTFEGTRRELLRVGHIVENLTHPMGAVEFNPFAKPGDADYGLLYIGGGEWGFSNGGGPNSQKPEQTQRLDTLLGAILRIDPRSPSVSKGEKGIGDYTIAKINTFAADGDPKTFGEIYATLYRHLGIDTVTATLQDPSGRPNFLVEDNVPPLRELV